VSGLRADVRGIGLVGPGLASYAAARPVLRGDVSHAWTAAAPPPPSRLPPAERRRAGPSIRLAMAVADEAVAAADIDPSRLATVFSSSGGEGTNCHALCETLASPAPLLSPTRFTNSVHNAPAGYWTIATGCHAPSNAVCAQRASFGAGLLEAASLVLADARAVLLVCSDTAGSGPLVEVTGCVAPFASALVLTPQPGPCTLGRLDLHLCPGSIADARPATAVPPAWVASSPSASALPLLALLAQGAGRCRLMAGGSLGMDVHLEECA